MIELIGLTKKFGNVTAVNNLSFTVGKGDIRPSWKNYAGKTNTLGMLATMLKPTSEQPGFGDRYN